MYMSAQAKLNDMISWTKRYSGKKWCTGKDIKEAILKCLSEEDSFYFKKNELLRFKERYIDSQYPLSDTKWYSLSWYGKEMDELRCYKAEEELQKRFSGK